MTPRSATLAALALTALCAVFVGCFLDPDPENDPPVIDTLTADPARAGLDSAVTVTVSAHDPEHADLDYAWTATAGWFESGSDAEQAVWRAPSSVGRCTLSVNVDDGRDDVDGRIEVLVLEDPEAALLQLQTTELDFSLEDTLLPVYLANEGGVLTDWSVAADVGWATPEPAAGTLEPGAVDTVFLHVDRNAAPAGLQAGSLAFAWEDETAELPFSVMQTWTYRVIAKYTHDTGAFTQGLLWHDGSLYEGTGRDGLSQVREVDLETGEVLRYRDLDADHFGEGLALWQDRLVQITYTDGIAYTWSLEDFTELDRFSYTGQGWGLTSDGTHLIMSIGSSALVFRDPETFEEIERRYVSFPGHSVRNLNELEWIEGEVWANIWGDDRVLRIDPESARVIGVIDLSGLLTAQEAYNANVLNGIAYDPDTGRLWVTGKLWPWVFEIELVDPADAG